MNKTMLPTIVALMISLFVSTTPLPATASSLVYDSTAAINGTGGWNVFENGDQITLGGSERMMTDFSFYYSKFNEGNNPNARVRFYANDGLGGKPNTVLYDSGELALQQGTGDFSYKLSGLQIQVPDTFTWSVLFGDKYPVLGEGWWNIEAFQAFLKTSDSPVVGSSENYFWYYDYYMQTWLKDPKVMPGTDSTPFSFSAKIDATVTPTPIPAAVPEPSTVLLVGGGLAGLASWRKKKRQ